MSVGGKGKQTSTQTQQNEPWAPTQGYLKDGLADLSSLYTAGGMKTDYSGDWIADMTDGQKAALQGVIGQAGQNTGTLQGLLGGLTSLADGTGQADTWNSIERDTVRSIMPGINSSFAGSGMTGSTVHADALSRGLSEGLATARSGYENNAIQQRLAATSSLGGVLDGILGNQQAAYDAESRYQAQAQNELDSQYQNSLLSQNADYEALTNYLSVLSGIAGLGGTSTGTTTGSKSSGLLGTIGGISAGLGGIGSIASGISGFGAAGGGLAGLAALSDRRLKEDIKRVGQTDSGLGVYTYRYRGSDRIHMGVMADEVQALMPDAVTSAGDFLAVDYGRL